MTYTYWLTQLIALYECLEYQMNQHQMDGTSLQGG